MTMMFRTSQSKVAPGKYIGHAVIERFINPKQFYDLLATKSGYPAAGCRAAVKAQMKVIRANAGKSVPTSVEALFSSHLKVLGGFDTATGPIDRNKNLVQLYPILTKEFRDIFKGVVPSNKTEGATPRIDSVLCDGKWDVVCADKTVSIAGRDLAPNTEAGDEGVVLANADKETLFTATVSKSEMGSVEATFEEIPSDVTKEYYLGVRTRSGLPGEFGVAVAWRKVKLG